MRRPAQRSRRAQVRRPVRKPTSVAELCDTLLSLEAERKLLELELRGVALWSLLRMPVYYELTRALGLFDAPHGSSRWRGRALKKALLWSYASLKSLLSVRRPRDLLIFDHTRKVQVGEGYIDIYTHPLICSLMEAERAGELSFEVYEYLSYQSERASGRERARRYTDLLISGAKLWARLTPIRLTPEERATLKTLEDALEERVGVRLELTQRSAGLLRAFELMKRRFHQLLKAHRPRVVISVVSYVHSMSALTEAARGLGIETIELQHGTFSPYHLGYHYPDQEAPAPYSTDYLFTFGDFWREAATLPFKPDQVKVYGFGHLHSRLSGVAQSQTREREVLFLSQGVISAPLVAYAVALAEANRARHLGLTITYKLHPSEYTTWRSSLPALSSSARGGALSVIDQQSPSLYELMSRAHWQVGVFSTALYEGLTLGCQTILVDLPGVEYMERLIDEQVVGFVTTHDELIEHISRSILDTQSAHDASPPNELGEARFFAPPNDETTRWLIERARSH